MISSGQDYWLAFLAGILGSGHCLGMCGSLVCGFFLKFVRQNDSFLPYLAYHAGRIGVYVLIGTLAALAGAALVQTGIIGKAQGLLKIVAGLVVILLGLDLLGWAPWRLPVRFLPSSWLNRLLSASHGRPPEVTALIGGIVNGFMPCAMVFSMAVKSTTAASPLAGGMLLLAFGLGTLPSMLFASVVMGKLGVRARGLLLKGAAVLVIALGVTAVADGIAFYRVMISLPNW